MTHHIPAEREILDMEKILIVDLTTEGHGSTHFK